MAILGAIAGSGAAIGVLLGGILTEYVGWEWIFFVNVPIAVGTLFFVRRFVRESRLEGDHRHFDALGAVTITSALMLLVYALTQANNNGWGSAKTIGILLVSAALHCAFLFIERRSPAPLVPLSFFRRRTPTGANVIGFGLGTMMFGTFFLLSLYMQQILGFSAMETGVGYLAVALTAVVAAGLSQALVTKIGVRPVLASGLLLLTGALIFFSQISVDGSYIGDLLPGFLLMGVGLGFSFVPISIAALGGVPPPEAGLASGLINTSQQIGGALGVAILTTVATSRTDNLLSEGESTPDAFVGGYSLAFWVAAVFGVISLIATFLLLRKRELDVAPAGTPIG